MSNSQNGFISKVDNYFGITKSGSKFRTEIIAGITTFMTMVYILMVNAGMFQVVNGGYYGAAYIATAIGAIVGTLLMAFLAKMPLAQASGMGINAFICFSLVGSSGISYANAMMFTLLDGVIFLILTVTGLRKKIFDAIPSAVRKAIGIGIGLFIAFIGFQNAGIVVHDDATLVKFFSLNLLSSGTTFMGIMPGIVAIIGVIFIAVLSKKKVKGAILWGILGSAVLYYIAVVIAKFAGNADAAAVLGGISLDNPFAAFGDWANVSAGKVFTEGFSFAGFTGTTGGLILLIATTALSLCMIDMFDTIGTLYGACSKGNLLDANGTPINMNKSMLADAIATCAGAVAGTSTVTTFVESSSGVAAGGKTGFTALVTGICFILAMFLSPIAQLIPSCATAAALVWVGVLMMSSVGKIDWEDPAEAIVAFFTMIIMCLGYSINKGIGIGILVYIAIKLFTGKVKEISIPTWVIGAIYLATFFLT